MTMEYPLTCDSARKKTEYLYKAQEELRILHNIFSKWLHEGLSKEEYEQIPEGIRVKYPYDVYNEWIEPVISTGEPAIAYNEWSEPVISTSGPAIAGDGEIQFDTVFEPVILKEGYWGLSEANFSKFKNEIFNPKSNAICQEICVQRAELKHSNWAVNLEEI